LRDVGAGREGAAGSGEDQRARLDLEPGAERVQRVDELLVDGVALLGPVEGREHVVLALLDAQAGAHTRSRMIAVPWPTPTHMVARPRSAPSRSMRPSSVTTRREPEEPSGWPSAIAPPSALTIAS